MKKKTVIISILIVLLSAAVPAAASSAGSQATTVTIEAEQTNSTDIMGVLNYLDIKGAQEGNVFAFTSKNASVTGNVDGLFLNASNQTTLAGELKKDVFAYATVMNIESAKFYDDLYVISGYSFSSDEGCEFNDNVYIYCAESVVLRGHIKGDVVIKANSVTIDATIDKNAAIYSDNIQLSQNAEIAGNLNYFSSLNASIDSGSTIGGKINRTDVPAKTSDSGLSILSVGIAIFRILFIVFLAWVLSRVSPKFTENSANLLRTHPGASFFAGLGILIGAPVAIILLIAFVLTIIPGIFLLGIYAFCALISVIPFAQVIARRTGVFNKESLWGIFVTICIITALSYVPYMGFIITFLATCMGMGCIFITFISRLKKRAINER